MPLLLSVAMGLFFVGALFGVLGLLMLYKVIANPVPDDPRFAINLQRTFIMAGVNLAVLGGLSGLAAYGIRTERLWARDAIVLWCAASCLGTFCFAASANGLGWKALLATANPIVFTLVTLWYLFRKSTVVKYYAALESLGDTDHEAFKSPSV